MSHKLLSSPCRLLRIFLIFVITAIFTLCSLQNSVLAVSGDLDPTFGNNGTLVIDLELEQSTSDYARAVAIQPDGKIVVAGSYNVSGTQFLIVARLNGNGSWDTTFGSGGKSTPNFIVITHDVLIQTDGKIVAIGGGFLAGRNGFALMRLNPNGSVDTSYGSEGKVVTDLGPGTFGIAGALQSDGKIVVAGSVGEGINVDFALVRHNTDGSLDTTFGSNGVVKTDILNTFDVGTGIAIQPDGKIIVVGRTSNFNIEPHTGEDFAVLRYNTNGSLDSSFGSGGIAITDFGSFGDEARDVVIQPDGKIVVAGTGDTEKANHTSFALARYLTNGSLDLSFGTGGKAMNDFSGTFSAVQTVALQPNKKILVFGITSKSFRTEFGLARYNPNGTLDTSFGTGGEVKTSFPDRTDFLGEDMAIQNDGKIIGVGHFSNSFTGDDFVLARYLNDDLHSAFDSCLQDEGSGNLLQYHSTSGEYLFTNCAGLSIGGAATITRRGNILTLQHNASDRRILAKIDAGSKKGTGSIQLLATGQTFSIADKNIENNTCMCSR